MLLTHMIDDKIGTDFLFLLVGIRILYMQLWVELNFRNKWKSV